MPPPYRAEDNDEGESDDEQKDRCTSELPGPPAVPRGTWKSTHNYWLDDLAGIRTMHQSLSAFAEPLAPAPTLLSNFLRSKLPRPRDPNAFYYKPDRPDAPREEFSLECKQWRHGVEPGLFECQIYFDSKTALISGAVECRIHAENLSKIAVKLVPIRIQVKHVSANAIAQELVERLSETIFA